MKTLLLAALLATSTQAEELPKYWSYDPYPEAVFLESLASDLAPSCELLLGPQETSEDTVAATNCAKSTMEWLVSIRGYPYDDEDTYLHKKTCAAKIVIAHSSEDITVFDLLNAEFDKACEPATM